MSSMPVSSMTDAAVLGYRLARWDYDLLKTHDVDTATYNKAKAAFAQLTKRSRDDTKKIGG